jgi:hypothetical protein
MANNTLAYGFVGLENLFAQRVDDVNIEVITDAIAQSVAEHNRQVQGIMSELVKPTEKYSARFRQAGAGTLQPLDEWGNPLPVREDGYYDVAWPIQGGGTAWGDNRVTRALMTVEEANEHTLNSLKRDSDWMKRHILAALLDDTAWTYTDVDKGSLTIQPLANGDTVTYLKRTGDSETDDHYIAQAAAIADGASPFAAIYSDLMEHPSNAGAEVVAYVPTALVSSIQGLTAFNAVQDPDVQLGSGSDLLTGSIDRGFGDELLGKVDKVWIVEWSQLPVEHMLCVARGSSQEALRMREYPAGELKGLFQEQNSPDGNKIERRFLRYAGFGAYNRVAALVYQVGNATYEIPTGYTTPLAV